MQALPSASCQSQERILVVSDGIGGMRVRVTPDCGPHCKTKMKRRAGGLVQTQTVEHCKRKNCKRCHRKPAG